MIPHGLPRETVRIGDTVGALTLRYGMRRHDPDSAERPTLSRAGTSRDCAEAPISAESLSSVSREGARVALRSSPRPLVDSRETDVAHTRVDAVDTRTAERIERSRSRGAVR